MTKEWVVLYGVGLFDHHCFGQMEEESDNHQGGRFKVKEWNAVVMWSWNTDVDTCAICRSKLMTLCIDCQAKVNSGEKGDCKVWFERVVDI